MRFRIPSLITTLALGALSPVAGAAPYWVTWEGDDYPENEGWERVGSGTDPARSLENGIMTLDGLANEESEDIYRMTGMSDPGPGEEFVVQWRLRVDAVITPNPVFQYDPGFGVTSTNGWRANVILGVDELRIFFDQTNVPFTPGMFHDWEFRSQDMRSFTISLNGTPVSMGNFVPSLPGAQVQWGDFVQGPTSRSAWDYFRFGVVPEPATVVAIVAAALIQRRLR